MAERRPRIKVVYDKLLDLRRQAGAPTPNSTNFLNKASTQGPGAPQGPPQPHAAQQGNGAGAPQGPPPGKVPPGQQYQMFETWANGYLAEQDWKALAPAAQLAETAA